MIWRNHEYTILVTLFRAKLNPLPQNYSDDIWEPLWTKAGVETFSERLNEKWRGVRVAEVFSEVVDVLGLEAYVTAMTIKADISDVEKTLWQRYYTDPRNIRHAIRVRVEMFPAI